MAAVGALVASDREPILYGARVATVFSALRLSLLLTHSLCQVESILDFCPSKALQCCAVLVCLQPLFRRINPISSSANLLPTTCFTSSTSQFNGKTTLENCFLNLDFFSLSFRSIILDCHSKRINKLLNNKIQTVSCHRHFCFSICLLLLFSFFVHRGNRRLQTLILLTTVYRCD